MTTAPAPRPLFVPLRSEHFAAFVDGTKTTEWRAWGPRWNDRAIAPGREIVLSKGYSGDRIRGVVVAVARVDRAEAPEVARAIYPETEAFCAITVSA